MDNLKNNLKQAFHKAAEESKKLTKKPSNEVLLQLYSLFKQAESGDVRGSRPGFTDPVGRAKFDAWTSIKGMSQETAMQKYVDLVQHLQSQN